jgi:hypothetical protein
VIEDSAVDPFVRKSAFSALAWLTATGQISRETTATYLRDLFTTLKSDDARLGVDGVAGSDLVSWSRGHGGHGPEGIQQRLD